jgi:MFS family permease
METAAEQPAKSPLREIVQPFIDVVRAPRALWGVNLSYLLEGMVYFGVVGYLAMYFNQYVGLSDVSAGVMVGALTWGITFSMFLFGGLADKWGVRIALFAALALMLVGRVLLAGGPMIGLPAAGLFSAVHLVALLGILLVVLGYGMYQPAAYAAVRLFTTPKTAGMAYAMLYALMNLGGWLPSFFAPIRKAVGISGAIWVYAAITAVGLIATMLILSRRTVEIATARAREASGKEPAKPAEKSATKEPFSVLRWLKNHPMADPKFAFFIFCLIPVQTLFAHNWLTLPMYVARAYKGTWTGDHFEVATNFNPLLIFILVPIVAALTQKAKVYNMMIAGTAVMAAPTFLLALGPSFWTLFGYLVIMTVGEAMWQPRFLQYAAEIAPEGRTGAYMGVAQFPWFLTKVITSLYSGWFLSRYCPAQGETHTERMWLIYGFIAISSTFLLISARIWLGKDFKTKAE